LWFLTVIMFTLLEFFGLLGNDTETERINFMRKYNVNELFKELEIKIKINTNSQNYQVSKIIIKTKYHRYHIFKVIRNTEISYYAIDLNKHIGSGGFSYVYEGFDILTQQVIVAKYGLIGDYEAYALRKTGLHIADMPDIVLMHKAHGIPYKKILEDRRITDQRKIEIHEKIRSKFTELETKYGIYHGDVNPRHIFVDEFDVITIIDFGLSYPSEISDTEGDMFNLDQSTWNTSERYCGDVFKKYICSSSNINCKSWIRKVFEYFCVIIGLVIIGAKTLRLISLVCLYTFFYIK